jgi:membrane protein DedA with SNARE-associated domain
LPVKLYFEGLFVFDVAAISEIFSQYAYQPYYVYGFIVLFMSASSFGLPIPEELTLVSAGLVAYTARNPDIYPPPYPGAESVNLITLSVVCFLAVLGSDIVVYFIGKVFGTKIVNSKLFKKSVSEKNYAKINNLFLKYSDWACGIFRFTPGVRFPGHVTCGLMGVPFWKFILIDGTAALLTVPTQVLLVAFYGREILDKIKEFKLALVIIIGVGIIFWLFRKFVFKKKVKIEAGE